MAKTKKNTTQVPLIVIGYTLFALLLVTILASTTVPLGLALFTPGVRHLNVVAMIVAFTVGSLLPVLLGYLIGDHSVKARGKLSHHFSGVLFGLLAFWLMLLLSAFVSVPSEFFEANRNASLMIVNILPSVGVAIITSILAVAHVRSRYAKQDVLAYKPFSVALIAAVAALPISSMIQNIATDSAGVYSFMPFALVLLFGFIAYVTLRKTALGRYEKIVWSAVAISVLFIATFVGSQFMDALSNLIIREPTMETQNLVTWIALGLSVVGWGVYWAAQVRSLQPIGKRRLQK